MTKRLTRDIRYVEVTDEYVYQCEKTPSRKVFDVTSKAKYFLGIIAAESTKRCRVVSRVTSCIPGG